MSKALQEQFVLSAPIASLEDLPAALKDAPIDRPALLEHLGKSRFIIGKVSRISHLTPVQVTAVQEQPYFKDFKGYSFIKNVEIVVPDNSIPLHKRHRVTATLLDTANHEMEPEIPS